jgi:hypothetical protein
MWDGLKASRGSKLVGVVKGAIRQWTLDTSTADDCRDIEGCRLHGPAGLPTRMGEDKAVVICPELCRKLALVLEKGLEVSNSDDFLGCLLKPL